MSDGFLGGPVHPVRTNRRGLSYKFTCKHHKKGESNDAQWLDGLSREDEFQVFNRADEKDISNDNGDLFGMHLDTYGTVLPLGSRKEKIAKFPFAREGETWHGYPLWPIAKQNTETIKSKVPVKKEVLMKMKEAGWITDRDRKRLSKGKDI